MNTALFFYKFGAYAMLADAALHMVGHFSGLEPRNETEETLMRLATTYELELGFGLKRTLMDIVNGFSLTFASYLAFVGVFNLLIAKATRDDPRRLRSFTLANIGFGGLLLLISAMSFPLPPTIVYAVILLTFSASLALGRETARVSA